MRYLFVGATPRQNRRLNMSEDPTSATSNGERWQLGEVGSDEQRLRKENRDEEPEHRRLEKERAKAKGPINK
ncbi:unnamed protein product [Brassica rapa subsp. narinosa]